MKANIVFHVFTLYLKCVSIVKKSAFYYSFASFKVFALGTQLHPSHLTSKILKLIKFRFISVGISYEYKIVYLKQLFLKLENTYFFKPRVSAVLKYSQTHIGRI